MKSPTPDAPSFAPGTGRARFAGCALGENRLHGLGAAVTDEDRYTATKLNGCRVQHDSVEEEQDLVKHDREVHAQVIMRAL